MLQYSIELTPDLRDLKSAHESKSYFYEMSYSKNSESSETS